MVKTARTILPNLKRLVLVGNPFEGAVYYPQFANEISEFSKEFEIIDLMGLPVREILQHVTALLPDSAVFYFGINADQERTYASAVEPLSLIAEAASQPIIGVGANSAGTAAGMHSNIPAFAHFNTSLHRRRSLAEIQSRNSIAGTMTGLHNLRQCGTRFMDVGGLSRKPA
jgi:hypothetical protein